ncbi:uncharacterized protein l(3)80Fj isoform X2 [Drosophila suzukii]|uniref:Uncharacterized protein l(3)80Fj isoform X2 n=1 Tax=Drosophila suzukii TaxID=28584 RepID=A0AB40AFE2_DROSZ|nr:uncharacterized protein LOC108011730 isoform X3 [Drosophila suzukii]
MVDEQLSSALRDLPGKVLNVPVEERQLIFRNVSSVLRNPGKMYMKVDRIVRIVLNCQTFCKDKRDSRELD